MSDNAPTLDARHSEPRETTAKVYAYDPSTQGLGKNRKHMRPHVVRQSKVIAAIVKSSNPATEEGKPGDRNKIM